MKKLFTLAAAVLASVSLFAQTENVGTYSTQVISSDGTTSTWTFILPSSQTNVPAGETEDVGIIYAPSASGKMKFTSSNQFSWQGQSSGYIPVPAGGAGTITMVVKGSSDSRFLQLYVAGEDAGSSKRLYSKPSDDGQISSDGKKGPQSFTFTADDLTTKGGKTYLHFKDNNTEMKITSFQVVLTSGLYGVPSTEPNAYVNKESLDLKIGRSGLEQKKDSFVLKGENLPNAAIATIDFPTHDGLSISPTSFAISEGKIDQKFVVTYAPSDFDDFNGVITLTADTFVIEVAITANKLEPQAELVEISDDITWDFSTAATADIQPADQNAYTIFTNASDSWKTGFAAESLAGIAQYLYYNGNKCFQGKALKFKTTVAGKVTVELSNTGSKDNARNLFINGVDTEVGSKTTGHVTASEIAVPAGEVILEGWEMAATPVMNMLRIYKVIFTKAEPTALDNTEASVKATKRIVNGQLLIEKNGVLYNAQGAVVK